MASVDEESTLLMLMFPKELIAIYFWGVRDEILIIVPKKTKPCV